MIVFGDNGTGKSTIADALEWYFSGRIAFLAAEGRGPAIRHMNANPSTKTTVQVESTGIHGGTRHHPGNPGDPAPTSETFLLRGRTLADFVNRTKGEKWKALAEILGLDQIDHVRLALQRAKNELEDKREAAKLELSTAERSLRTQMATAASQSALLDAIRRECAAAEKEQPATLQIALDPGWVNARSVGSTDLPEAAARANVVARTGALETPVLDLECLAQWNAGVTPQAMAGDARVRMLQGAKTLIGFEPHLDSCPLCGQPVELQTLGGTIASELVHLEASAATADATRAEVRRLLNRVRKEFTDRVQLRADALACGIAFGEPIEFHDSPFEAALATGSELPVASLETSIAAMAKWDEAAKGAAAGLSVPERDARETALVNLAVLVERGRSWTTATKSVERYTLAATWAATLFALFQQKEGEEFQAILNSITDRVSDIYSKLHPSEGLSAVRVEPWSDKGIELSVDFHGARVMPPRGVLSESHLNSLAIALFLAMAETFNRDLGFVVLDDIVNSFDVSHRGQLAELLVNEFTDTQLIILTHDQIFYQHVARRAPAWAKLELTSWSYREGPRTHDYATGGFIELARERLDSGDRSGAATKTRRALEELLQEICEAIAAPLAFRRGAANDRREIGELFLGLRHELKASARPFYDRILPLLTALEADTAAALNVEAHAAPGWASTEEVGMALSRVEELDRSFTCPACNSRAWGRGSPVSGRCRCGRSAFPPLLE